MMSINIGNKNKIKNSNIVDGDNISINKRGNKPLIKAIFITIISTVIAGIILIAIEYFFSILGLF